ncbi:MAG: ParB/RepB/Spo0J family partition protein [Scytonematopsis contorta HA4267-MV1]|jgi:ParB family chromosome partitioning protein|nr:ParB/RepB/Spo0J family partition protein [Scytonematopsis contorta HA4267-MV1]
MKNVPGLFANIDSTSINPEESKKKEKASTLLISSIVLPPSQPRRYFDQEKLEALAKSITEVGLLEPIVVRDIGESKYELIAGERRLKACEIAGLSDIAINLIQCDDDEAKHIRLIENLQREDLNVFEETIGILELLEILLEVDQEEVIRILRRMENEENGKVTQNVLRNPESLTIQELFSKLGKITWQSFIASRLPLLKLKEDIKEALLKGQLEYTKALAISKIKDDEKRGQVLKQAIESKLSLSKIKELVEEALAESPTLEKPSKNKLPVLKPKEFSNRISKVTKIGKASSIWSNPQQVKQLAKYLSQIEKLFAEAEPQPELQSDDENNSEENSDNTEE